MDYSEQKTIEKWLIQAELYPLSVYLKTGYKFSLGKVSPSPPPMSEKKETTLIVDSFDLYLHK